MQQYLNDAGNTGPLPENAIFSNLDTAPTCQPLAMFAEYDVLMAIPAPNGHTRIGRGPGVLQGIIGAVVQIQTDLVTVQTSADAATGAIVTLNTALTGKVDKVSGKGLSTEDYTTGEKTKLSGIATDATANSSDATLLARANHTGTQAQSTVVNLTTDLAATSKRANFSGLGTLAAHGVSAQPTNLSTNYNLVSGVLGVADGLNTANSQQNALAAAFNTILTWLGTNKDSMNGLRTAGAA